MSSWAEGVDRAGHDAAGRVEVGDGVVIRDRFAAERLDLAADLRRRVLAGPGAVQGRADIVDYDAGPGMGHRERELASDAPTGAGDDRDPAVEEAHRGP